MAKLLHKIMMAILFFVMPMVAYCQQEIKLMSYNIRLDLASDGENRWDLRKEKVAGLMNYYGADFKGSQEVLHHQLEYLVKNMNSYGYIGGGRDDGKEAGEYSCIFYNKNEFSLIKEATFWLSLIPDTVSKGWDAALNRLYTYGLFKSKKTKQLLWFFNTHFDHVGKLARQESAKLIVKKIEDFNTKGYPVILTGDFNLRPGEEPVQYLSSKMQDARSFSRLVYGNDDTFNGFNFTARPNGTIDYIFTNGHKNLSVSKFATLTDSYDLKYPSDHFPVMATMLLSKK